MQNEANKLAADLEALRIADEALIAGNMQYVFFSCVDIK